MSATVTNHWHETNQLYLRGALAEVRQALERHAVRSQDGHAAVKPGESAQQALREATTPGTASERSTGASVPAPSALETFCEMFGLSPGQVAHDLDSLFALWQTNGLIAANCSSRNSR